MVVSSRFADIFRGNAGKQGLLAAECAQSDVELLWKLLEAEPGTEVTVDLEDKTVRAKDFTAPFQIDDYTRWRLLEGLDDIALTLRHEDDIGAFEGGRPSLEADHDLYTPFLTGRRISRHATDIRSPVAGNLGASRGNCARFRHTVARSRPVWPRTQVWSTED